MRVEWPQGILGFHVRRSSFTTSPNWEGSRRPHLPNTGGPRTNNMEELPSVESLDTRLFPTSLLANLFFSDLTSCVPLLNLCPGFVIYLPDGDTEPVCIANWTVN